MRKALVAGISMAIAGVVIVFVGARAESSAVSANARPGVYHGAFLLP